jgi:hypothetical protein
MKIKSKSDVITNSSSEVWCQIKGPAEKLEELEDALLSIFGWQQEPEMDVCIYRDESPDTLNIDFPYHLDKYKSFYRAGLEELIKEFPGTVIEYT